MTQPARELNLPPHHVTHSPLLGKRSLGPQHVEPLDVPTIWALLALSPCRSTLVLEHELKSSSELPAMAYGQSTVHSMLY